ncbi:energy-coupling factor transport system permease protein [Thermosyntropha lipolytica DSM 11003]|uniref:Energy-coupling factor transport system permease protein n=1 Tax=Thermosyntropha lipolytica DSM 11003 TaxID=1123382 RepID=A0A1M5MDG0_9FIRM|nr:energy-coupling factor transporter transmembrane protein EcfT [Thermosyntropha lipolytica]SHG75266.1 energy-coupling factor transport system permease protein [Thermosyntropha lipolytica DSM 11003]
MQIGAGIGQYVPGNSFLHSLDPRSKLVSTMLLVISVLVADFPFPLIAVLLVIMLEVILSRVGIAYYLRSAKPLLYLVLLTVFLQLLLGGKAVNAFSLFWRLTGVIMVLQVMMATTSPLALMAGGEKMLMPLKRLKLPLPELMMIMTIALRFIPLYMEEWERIKRAQMSRGIDFYHSSLIKRLKNLMAILVPLFRISFQRADDLALAMEARCYRGLEGRTCLYDLKITGKDLFWIAVAGGIACISICL